MEIFPDYSLCIRAHNNAVKHGFWDKDRDYIQDFQKNVLDEFEEVSEILVEGKREVTEVYYTEQKDGSKKLEGVPTELADIIIFVLDYIGGQNIDEQTYNELLLKSEEVREKYKKGLERIGGKASKNTLFEAVKEECKDIICGSQVKPMLLDNPKDSNAVEIARINELLKIVQCIIAYAEYYEIDIQERTIEKMAYNEKRPVKYKKEEGERKIGGTDIDDETLKIQQLSELLVSGSNNSEVSTEELVAIAEQIKNTAGDRLRRICLNGSNGGHNQCDSKSGHNQGDDEDGR